MTHAAGQLLTHRMRALAVTPGWPRHLTMLGTLTLLILLLFRADIASMAAIWWTSSTYEHCLLIPLLVGWLVQQRLVALRLTEPAAWGWGLVWLTGGAFLWLLGSAGALAVLRQGALVVMIQGIVAACLGPAVTRILLFPLFYAFFMVPVGSELEPMLQLLTAKIAMTLLGVADVPAHIEGIFITIPAGIFTVAEACSGAKFLVAMTAYGVLVCHVCFRSWPRRAVFLAAALITSILANGVRAFATIYVAHRTSIYAAIGFDHVLFGWLFFALVMAVVMLAAWPFFDRKPVDSFVEPAAPGTGGPGTGHRLPVVAAGAVAILIAAPLWSQVSAGQPGNLAQISPPDVPGWRRIATPAGHPWTPRFAGADRTARARYGDREGHVVDVAIAAYAAQSEGRELIGFGQGAVDTENGWQWLSPAWSPDNGRGETITAPGPHVRHVVTFYRIGDGPPTGSATQVKLSTLRARLLGQDQRAVAILVSAERGVRPADASIRAFLRTIRNPEDLADAEVRTR